MVARDRVSDFPGTGEADADDSPQIRSPRIRGGALTGLKDESPRHYSRTARGPHEVGALLKGFQRNRSPFTRHRGGPDGWFRR